MNKNFPDAIAPVLYLPTGFEDHRYVIGDFSPMFLHEGLQSVFHGVISETPTTSFKKGRPQTKFNLTDGRYYLRFIVFGDVRTVLEKIKSNQNKLYVKGQVVWINNFPYLNSPTLLDENDVGKIKPVYPGLPGKMSPEAVGKYIETHAKENISKAAAKIRSSLAESYTNAQVKNYLNVENGLTLDTALMEIHFPTDIDFAHHCLKIMNRLASLLAASEIISLSKNEHSSQHRPPIYGPAYELLAERSSFQLTDEQEGIIRRSLDSISRGVKLNILLMGDVGTGKTITYSLIAAYVAFGGGRVAIMLPNGNLCSQIFQEFNELYPDLNPLLVDANLTGEMRLHESNVLIGTTALLFRDLGSELDLVIFDESQKMAVEQQSKLTGKKTHKISVSATPIPRTMALATYGAVTIEKITKCHADKQIYTRVIHSNWNQLVDEILWSIYDAGKQAVIVCARKEDDGNTLSDVKSEVISVEDTYNYFSKILPNLVVTSHSGLTTEQNSTALNDMRSGKAKLLVATTVVEVGVTLPDVNYLAVLNPERFGLSQMHQLRGRVARRGGEGWFTMFLSKELSNQKTIQRLNILVETTDGFRVAEKDMELRGIGDVLNATSQHGKYVGLIRNAEIELSTVETIIADLRDTL